MSDRAGRSLEAVGAVDHVPVAAAGSRRARSTASTSQLGRGEIVALVGESGCGKTTLARTLLGLERPSAGQVLVAGEPLRYDGAVAEGVPPPGAARAAGPDRLAEPAAHRLRGGGRGAAGARRRPATSRPGSPRRCPGSGMRPAERYFLRYPHELSGGQRQRVVIAGALVLEPEVLVADEPVSSLDASVRGEILALLLRLRDELGLSVLVVTHDLGLAWNIADRIAVMYLGRIVESGPTEQVLADPSHPYTQALLSVVPETQHLEPIVLAGEPPDPTRVPAGCRFHPRCPALASGEADEAGRRRRLPLGRACRCCPPTGNMPPPASSRRPDRACLLTHESVRREERRMATLQAALPAPYYVDEAHWRRERERRAAPRVVLRRAAVRRSGSAAGAGSGSPSSTSPARACSSRGTTTGELRAFYNVCRHRGSQVVPVDPDVDAAGAVPARRRCAARTTPGPTTSPGGCCARRTPRTSTTSTRRSSGCTRSRAETWGGFLFLHLDAGERAAAARVARRGARAGAALPARLAGRRATG